MPTYRLMLADDARGPSKRVEFDSSDAKDALSVLVLEKEGRRAELWVDGLRLCSLTRSHGGFWLVNA